MKRLLGLLSFVLGCGLVQGAHAALGVSVSIKNGEPTAINPGQQTVIRITLSNNNELAPITSTAFSNVLPGVLPNGLLVAGAVDYSCVDPSGSFFPTGSVTATPGTQTIVLADGTVPARANSTDGTCTIDIPITAGTSNGDAATYVYSILDAETASAPAVLGN